ncbi:MAG: hypothetical protein WCH46_07345 [bacterium]
MEHYQQSFNKLFAKFTSSIAGIILTLLLFTTAVEAQCPSCSGITLGCPGGATCYSWNSVQLVVSITGGCDVTVCYCWREVHNFPFSGDVTFQSVITRIDSVAGCNNNITTADFVAQISAAVKADLIPLISTGNVPPCTGPVITWHSQMFLPACFKRIQISTSPNRWAFIPCHLNSYCVMSFDLCRGNNGAIETSNVTYTTQGTVDCDDAPTKVGDWLTDGTCYHPPCGM